MSTPATGPSFDLTLDSIFYLMKVRDAIKLIEKDGWKHKRTRGDHRILKQAGLK